MMFDEEMYFELDEPILPDVNDLQMAYEQEPINAFCDICGCEQRGTTKHLQQQGWDIGRGHEICPMHD